MTCAIGFVSEYIKGCDISKFGEGCETCIQYFTGSKLILVLGVTIIAILFLLWMNKKGVEPQ